jgi:phospholipase/carboxylesterase
MENETHTAFPHLFRPANPSDKEPILILLFHGYGSNAEDLFALERFLPPEAIVLSFQAPLLFGSEQYAWFPLDWSGARPTSRIEDVQKGRVEVRARITFARTRYNISAERTVLLGFSQGAILALAAALETPDLARHVVALSGRLSHALHPTEPVSLRVFVGHGKDDPVIPVVDARELREALLRVGASVEYREYEMGHAILPEEIDDLSRWLSELR